MMDEEQVSNSTRFLVVREGTTLTLLLVGTVVWR